ncbi:MAG: LysR family transcriptional regulator [Pseudomonadales bacterium]|nr:LysR family transcriptional regulator [Pseudomonadales bacterium]
MSRWEGFEEFVEVVNQGSFSKAAKVLGVSKSHVSQQVSRLEDRLNARLLHRTTRKLSLTETGEIYYAQCRQVVEDLEAAELAVNSLQEEIKGHLRIAAPHLIGEALMVPALAELSKQNPSLKIELDLTSHRVDLIAERFDLAIQVGERQEVNVVNKKLAPTNFHVVASPAYLKQYGTPQKPSDLKAHNCLLFVGDGYSKPWRFKGPKGTQSIQVSSSWSSNSGTILKGAAEQDMGLAYMPDY